MSVDQMLSEQLNRHVRNESDNITGRHSSLILGSGRRFYSAPLTDEEQKVLKKARNRKRFYLKNCYVNSRRLMSGFVRDGIDVTYVEGFMMIRSRGNFTFEHGWLSLNDKLIDPTSDIFGEFDESDIAVIGVEFDPAKLTHCIQEYGLPNTFPILEAIATWRAGRTPNIDEFQKFQCFSEAIIKPAKLDGHHHEAKV